MITMITGVVGAGKTVFCIEELVKLKAGSSSYNNHDFIYSNIANFKLDYFDNTPFKYVHFSFVKIYAILKELYHIALENEENEELKENLIIEKAKEHNFYNCFIIFDECHNFFDNQDKIKIWYITYHRHIAHNIFLITQNKMLINTKYRQSPELFIKALPQSKKITIDFKYNTYGEFTMKDKIETITIKNRPELFEMYTSGNFTKQKSYAKKPLIIFFLSVTFVISLVVFLFYFMFSQVPETPQKTNTPPPIVAPVAPVVSVVPVNKKSNKDNFVIDSDSFVLKVFYISTLGYKVNNDFYPDSHFNSFLKVTDSKILSVKQLYRDDTRSVKTYFIKTKKVYMDNFFVSLPEPPKIQTVEEKNNLPNLNPFGTFITN